MFRLAGQFLLERQQRSAVGSIVNLLLDTVHTAEAHLMSVAGAGGGRRVWSKLRCALDPETAARQSSAGRGKGGATGGRARASVVAGSRASMLQRTTSGRVDHIRQALMNSIFDGTGVLAEAASRRPRRRRRRGLDAGSEGGSSSSGSMALGSDTSSANSVASAQGGGDEHEGHSDDAASRRTGGGPGQNIGDEAADEVADDRLTRRCVEKALEIFEAMKGSFKRVCGSHCVCTSQEWIFVRILAWISTG